MASDEAINKEGVEQQKDQTKQGDQNDHQNRFGIDSSGSFGIT